MTSKKRLNVVLVVFDTLRRDAVSAYGTPPPWPDDFPAIRTPHLDRFARSAVRFDRAFPESLPTLPARRALYTGQRVYPFHGGDFRLKGEFVAAPGWGPIPEDQSTLAEIMSGAGYRTGLVSDLYHQFKPSKNFTRGFDQWTFIRGQESDPARSGPRPTPEQVFQYIPAQLLQARAEAGLRLGIEAPPMPEWAAGLVRNFYDRTVEEDWTSAQVMSGAATWLDQNRDARETGEGIFLTVECFDPHEPWFVPASYRERYDSSDGQDNVLSPYAEVDLEPALVRRTRANYAGLVTMVDRWFGTLVSALEAGGWLDDTIVAVLSDHGHSMLERGYLGKRGYPGVPEVFAVPLLLRLPGGEHGGATSEAWVQHHDLAATLLALAGVPPPAPLDGISVADCLTSGAPSPRDHVVCGWGSGIVVVTDEWWLSIKANGRGALLYPRTVAGTPDAVSVADRYPRVVDELFAKALAQAGDNGFPDFVLDAADRDDDAPGCSPVAAAR